MIHGLDSRVPLPIQLKAKGVGKGRNEKGAGSRCNVSLVADPVPVTLPSLKSPLTRGKTATSTDLTKLDEQRQSEEGVISCVNFIDTKCSCQTDILFMVMYMPCPCALGNPAGEYGDRLCLNRQDEMERDPG